MEPQESNKIIPNAAEVNNEMVQTYAEDMAQVIGDNKEGVVRNIIHEEEANEIERINLSPETKKNKIFVILGSVLFLIAVGIVSFILINQKAATVVVPAQFVPMIFNDKAGFVVTDGLSKDTLERDIFNEAANTNVKYGGVEGIYLTSDKNVVGLRDFIKLTKSSLVVSDNTDLVDDNFLIGVYSWETRTPFILIKIRSLPDIFDSMHAWESKMFYDLHGFFGIDITADNNYLLSQNFDDTVVENKNARILYDNYGGIVMMYVYVDDTHVLVTNDPEAVGEIINRLAASSIKK